MALAINTGAVLAKLFSEAVEAIDPASGRRGARHRRHAAAGSRLGGAAPGRAAWTSYALYRFESNARSATVLGLIGAGGIGQTLFDSINGFQYRQTSAICVVIVIAVTLIDLLSQAIRQRLI
jgi:phosphonate transport system permease protein